MLLLSLYTSNIYRIDEFGNLTKSVNIYIKCQRHLHIRIFLNKNFWLFRYYIEGGKWGNSPTWYGQSTFTVGELNDVIIQRRNGQVSLRIFLLVLTF